MRWFLLGRRKCCLKAVGKVNLESDNNCEWPGKNGLENPNVELKFGCALDTPCVYVDKSRLGSTELFPASRKRISFNEDGMTLVGPYGMAWEYLDKSALGKVEWLTASRRRISFIDKGTCECPSETYGTGTLERRESGVASETAGNAWITKFLAAGFWLAKDKLGAASFAFEETWTGPSLGLVVLEDEDGGDDVSSVALGTLLSSCPGTGDMTLAISLWCAIHNAFYGIRNCTEYSSVKRRCGAFGCIPTGFARIALVAEGLDSCPAFPYEMINAKNNLIPTTMRAPSDTRILRYDGLSSFVTEPSLCRHSFATTLRNGCKKITVRASVPALTHPLFSSWHWEEVRRVSPKRFLCAFRFYPMYF